MNTESTAAMKKMMIFGGGLGLVLVLGVIVLILVKKKLAQQADGANEPGGLVMASAMAAVLKGQETTELLAQLVFDTLRLGNFRAYRAAFASFKELETFFSLVKADQIKKIVTNEEHLKQVFEVMRLSYVEKRGDFLGLVSDQQLTIKGPQGQSTTVLYNCRLRVAALQGEAQIHIGAILKGSFGWKILLPESAQELLKTPA